jgi:hypothetical protein
MPMEFGRCEIHAQAVDRFNKSNVSALIAPSNSTLMVLHTEGKPSDDNIKHFLFDVCDLYMKVCLFYALSCLAFCKPPISCFSLAGNVSMPALWCVNTGNAHFCHWCTCWLEILRMHLGSSSPIQA